MKNEEERISACLLALDAQTQRVPDQIVLLLNNCTDKTAVVVNELKQQISIPLHVIEVELPIDRASAGYARGLAMDAAEAVAGTTGVLLTTDADGRVDPNWIEANLNALEAGADAVAGWAELDPSDWSAIPFHLHEDDARECAYDVVCDELQALIDPDPSDPWPRHTQASGASIAVTLEAYRRVGGLPRVSTGEDRALIAALRRHDAKVRHAPECRVVVSGRIFGRAAGGMADTIRRRLVKPDLFLDARLEPANDCARRALLRRLARDAYEGNASGKDIWSWLGVAESELHHALAASTFGVAWERLESASLLLQRRRVPVRELALQQVAAERLRDAASQGPAELATLLPLAEVFIVSPASA